MSKVLEMWAGMTGTVLDFCGHTPPDGWLFADGSAVSRTTYPNLFAKFRKAFTCDTTNASNVVQNVNPTPATLGLAVGMYVNIPGIAGVVQVQSIAGTTVNVGTNATATAVGVSGEMSPYGLGDGSTTFNLPDLRGRVAAGRDNMGGTAAARLTASGTGNPSLDGTALGAAGGTDRHQLTVAQMPNHQHNMKVLTDRDTAGSGTQRIPITNSGSATEDPTNANGGNEHHPNVQPTIILNKIIKT